MPVFYFFGSIENDNGSNDLIFLSTRKENIEHFLNEKYDEEFIYDEQDLIIKNVIIPEDIELEDLSFVEIKYEDLENNKYFIKEIKKVFDRRIFKKLNSDNNVIMNFTSNNYIDKKSISLSFDKVNLVVENVNHGNYSYLQMVESFNQEKFRFIVDCKKSVKDSYIKNDAIFVLTHWHQDHSYLLETITESNFPNFQYIVLSPEPILFINQKSLYRVNKIKRTITKLKKIIMINL